jgi:hypothetical protein
LLNDRNHHTATALKQQLQLVKSEKSRSNMFDLKLERFSKEQNSKYSHIVKRFNLASRYEEVLAAQE